MFTHMVVGATDLDAAKAFYDATFAALGLDAGFPAGPGRLMWTAPTGGFMVGTPINGQPASAANGGTIGFVAGSPEQVKAWHDAGVANGGTSCEDPPGVRDYGAFKQYSAYLRDPTGNKLCASCPVS